VLAALRTHGVEGIDAKGLRTHNFQPATNWRYHHHDVPADSAVNTTEWAGE
jgi:hypothetical protein